MNDFIWEIWFTTVTLGSELVDYSQDPDFPYMKTIEFDANLEYMYLPNEDWEWIMEIMNNKLFPSATPICDNYACWFTNPCSKVGLDGMDFTLELHTPTAGKSYNFTIPYDELFIDGSHIDNAAENTCYMTIFNFGSLKNIDKRNKWVLGKMMT